MGEIKVENIRIYAYHGCLDEERIIGSDYIVNVSVRANLDKASETDVLSDTVDYVHINRIVKEEMKIPSNLLEHIAKRIAKRIFKEIYIVKETNIEVSKINPPIGGDVEKVSVKLNFIR